MGLVLFAWLSDQKYFKELTDINTLSMLREKSEKDVMDELMPFGFYQDGNDDDSVIDIVTLQDFYSIAEFKERYD